MTKEGYIQTEEAKERMRRGHAGCTITPEHRQKISAALKGRKYTPLQGIHQKRRFQHKRASEVEA